MTENLPHIVYPRNRADADRLVPLFNNYANAFDYWRAVHEPVNDPHLIGVISRVIDPSVPVIDPSE